MQDFAEPPPPPLSPLVPPEPEPEPPLRSRWPLLWAGLAWVAILGLVTWEVVNTLLIAQAPQKAADDERLELMAMRAQARYLVAARQAFHLPDLYEQAKKLNTGPVSQRLRFVVLAGELSGPAEALEQLRLLDEALKKHGRGLSPEQAAVRARARLGRLYGDYEQLRFDAPSLSDKDRAELHASLDWFGELALAPDGRRFTRRAVLPAAGGPAAEALAHGALPDEAGRERALEPAERTLWAFLGVATGALLGGLVGLIGLIVFLVLVARGTLRLRFESGLSHGGVYAETFALWLALFQSIRLFGPWLPADAPRLLVSNVAVLLSLSVLGWPVVRGVPWRQVARHLGLTLGRRPAAEPACGLACYLMCLPVVGVGAVLALLLQGLFLERTDEFAPLGGPSHPIALEIARGDFWVRLEVLVLACIMAPLLEEIMFRGLLYRNLRELTGTLGRGWSFFLSATGVSFLFAAIHPQGLLGVPVLMALAYGFALVREWRGTLLPAMVAHGVNNGLVTVFAMLTLGD